MEKYRSLFMFMFKRFGLCVLIGLAGLATPATAGTTQLVTCPSLSTAQMLGDCPNETDLKTLYRETCSPMLEKNGDCTPYEKFAKSKNKALWGAKSAQEEYLSYIQCTLSSDIVKASKIIDVETKCDLDTGRCEARCGYENDVTFSLRVKGSCTTANQQKIDCQNDPKLCVATCEVYE